MDDLQRYIRFLVFVMFTCAASALSQVDKNLTTTSTNGLTDDAWAFQFSIQSSFSLGAFQGGLLSAKHHLAPDKAIRIGLGAYFNSSDYTGLRLTMYDTSKTSTSTNAGVRAQDFDIRMQYVIYPDPTADINAFFGLGPLVGFFHSSSERQELATPSNGAYANAEKRTTWSAGLSGLAGVNVLPGVKSRCMRNMGLRFDTCGQKATKRLPNSAQVLQVSLVAVLQTSRKRDGPLTMTDFTLVSVYTSDLRRPPDHRLNLTELAESVRGRLTAGSRVYHQ